MAHEGQAGATRLTKIPDELAPKFHLICRFTRKTIIARTIPAKTDVMIRKSKEDIVIIEIVPLSNEKNKEKEKSEKRIL